MLNLKRVVLSIDEITNASSRLADPMASRVARHSGVADQFETFVTPKLTGRTRIVMKRLKFGVATSSQVATAVLDRNTLFFLFVRQRV